MKVAATGEKEEMITVTVTVVMTGEVVVVTAGVVAEEEETNVINVEMWKCENLIHVYT